MLATVLLSWFPWNNGENVQESSSENSPEGSGAEEPTDKELRVEAYKEEKKINKLEQKIEGHRKKYQNYLKKGADASKSRRQLLAMKARLEKFKGNLRQLEQKKATRNLIQLETKRGEQEIRELAEEVTGDSDALADEIEINVGNFSEMATEAEAQIHADMEQTQEAMKAMESPNVDFEGGQTEEQEIMEQIAEEDADPEQFDLGDVDLTDQDASEDMEWEDSEEFGGL